MADASWPLQQALYDALVAALAAHSPSFEVYDAVGAPADASFPHITVGEATAIDDSTKTHDGQDHSVTIHAWDRGHRGFMRAKQALAIVYDRLHQGSLTVSGQTVAGVTFDYADTLVEPDGITVHCLHRYAIHTQTTS